MRNVEELTLEATGRDVAIVSLSPEEVFEERFRGLVHEDAWVLDAGCGAGKFAARRLRGINYFLTGIDVCESVGQNQHVDSRVGGSVSSLPFADNSFDVIYGRWLVEHLENPVVAMREFYRVLKPGGRLAIFTTNLLHYYGGTAKVTPHRFHLWFNRQRGFTEDDIFPTYYRANTRWRLGELLAEAGFQKKHIEIELVEGAAEFLSFNSVLHRLGRSYEYLVKRFEGLSAFRMNLIAIARKE
jgi:ubiquinone/menaquinone biosynthesis C-methylase UbiE